jgi:methionine biosynthesis protein MetW
MTKLAQDKILDRIIRVVKPQSRVLDLGCGDGTLLADLHRICHTQGYGIEINSEKVLSCIQKGIWVYQGDLDEGLSGIPDHSYEYVILSHTLQEIHRPVMILNEMLRVGQKGIVTFPNFGFWRVRLHLIFSGKTPVSDALPFTWYNTPNIRVLTIEDFKQLCRDLGFKVTADYSVSHYPRLTRYLPFLRNLLSEHGVFVIEKIT